MAYSAIEKMRKKNAQIYGSDVGPMQPALSAGAGVRTCALTGRSKKRRKEQAFTAA